MITRLGPVDCHTAFVTSAAMGLSAARRRVLALTASISGVGLVVLLLVGWELASRPVVGTEGLLSQQNMLVAVFQAALSYVIAMSTVYYAMRSADMADAMRETSERDAVRDLDTAVGNLVGAALRVVTTAGIMAPLMSRATRPFASVGPNRRVQDQLLLAATGQTWEGLGSALRWSEEIAFRRQELRDLADAVVKEALASHQSALDGRTQQVDEHARRARAATDALRTAVRHADQ